MFIFDYFIFHLKCSNTLRKAIVVSEERGGQKDHTESMSMGTENKGFSMECKDVDEKKGPHKAGEVEEKVQPFVVVVVVVVEYSLQKQINVW